MSVSSEQFVVYGVMLTFAETEAFGFGDDFWEEYCESRGYPRGPHVVNDVSFVCSVLAGKYWVGRVLKTGQSPDYMVGSFDFDSIRLSVQDECVIQNKVTALGIQGKLMYHLVTTYG